MEGSGGNLILGSCLFLCLGHLTILLGLCLGLSVPRNKGMTQCFQHSLEVPNCVLAQSSGLTGFALGSGHFSFNADLLSGAISLGLGQEDL